MSEWAATEHGAAVTREVAAHCLDGLVHAAVALVGNEVGRVCRTFDAWLGEARRTWPWLPGLCFDALAPIGVGFPAEDDRAVVLGRLLVGAETDAAAVRAALADLGRPLEHPAGGSDARLAPLPNDAAGALRARRLVVAVDGFWAELARGARAVHEPVVLSDRAGADRVVSRTRRLLEDRAEEVAWLAGAVAHALPSTHAAAPSTEDPEPGRLDGSGNAPATGPIEDLAATGPLAPPSLPPASPIPPVSPVPPPGSSSARPRSSRSPRLPSSTPPRRGGASASMRTGPVSRPPSAADGRAGASRPSPPRPRERTWEPIAFLVLALVAAVAVLWRVGGL